MDSPQATPVIIGVGDVKNRSTKVEDAVEPAQLMLEAIHQAIQDTHLNSLQQQQLQSQIDSIDVVRTWTWPYRDLPGLLAEKLCIQPAPRHQFYTDHGGNQPVKLLDEAARRIALGKSKVAVITGGEALASLTACAKTNKLPPPGWTSLDQPVDSVFSPSTLDLGEDLGGTHSIGAPIHVYPLYENAFRAYRGQSIKENNDESAQLYAKFSQVAAQNPLSWNYGKPAETAESIGTVSKRNRMICFPYPLLMNAFNTVNLAAACLLTSTEYARQLGVPESRWIYPLGGAGTKDSERFWERPDFFTSPSISHSLDEGLRSSGLTAEDIDLFDFYSCFPIVPKLACHHLGLDILNPKKPITLLGGLTSFGGAGNNYSMHAITEMVRQLRTGPAMNGLILANGGVLSYQHVVCLSSKPRSSSYPDRNPLPEVITDVPVPPIAFQAEGEAIIELTSSPSVRWGLFLSRTTKKDVISAREVVKCKCKGKDKGKG
ncbi:hypothetical protein VTN77DRAFT_1005 [Rasamsonia byssochlamydoides]|uniref:uncharacterized protein n=1 Tax=Rasamsonia byssochlamydoides TaxID=89139 RepID=UPI003741EE79